MKMKKKLLLFSTFLTILMSCSDVEIVVEQANVNDGITYVNDEHVIDTPDDKLHKAQSDFNNMLMDQIIYIDSKYVLNMSKEEALDLTIPDSLYVLYLNIVDDLNTCQ